MLDSANKRGHNEAMNTETIRAELRNLNIAEVARRAGVSRQGLSRFVNTDGRGLQSRTADRVAAAIEQLKRPQPQKEAA